MTKRSWIPAAAAACVLAASALSARPAAASVSLKGQPVSFAGLLLAFDDDGDHFTNLFSPEVVLGDDPYVQIFHIFQSLIRDGQSSEETTIEGDVTLTIGEDYVRLAFDGRGGFFDLNGYLGGMPAGFQSADFSTTGVVEGFSEDFGGIFDEDNVAFTTSFYGYQPDIHTTQTAFLTFGDAPEPGAWALMIAGFAGVGAMLRRRSTAAKPLPAA